MKTFLVLEDEPLIAMDLKFAFQDAGHEAITVIDNDEALSCIDDGEIAGAVLDVSLGSGQTCKRTADRLLAKNIPFILHTGDLDRIGENLRRIDAPVVSKPRPTDDVIAALMALLAKDAGSQPPAGRA